MNCCPCLFSTFYRGTYGTGKYWFFSSHSGIVIPDLTPELILVRSSLFHWLSCLFWNTCISASGMWLMEDNDLLSPDGCHWPSHMLGAIDKSSKVSSAGRWKCTDSASFSEDMWHYFLEDRKCLVIWLSKSDLQFLKALLSLRGLIMCGHQQVLSNVSWQQRIFIKGLCTASVLQSVTLGTAEENQAVFQNQKQNPDAAPLWNKGISLWWSRHHHGNTHRRLQ